MKIVSIVSARPNFVKLAAVHHAFQKHAPKDWKHIIVHTGQHYDPLLSDVFFKELDIPQPDENLEVKSEGSNEDTVEHTKRAAIPVLKKLQPDLLIVYGDVSGALGGAQAAQECGIPIAHVEAGLRSRDLSMPEEHNRIGIDRIAGLLFVTEQSGEDNLEKEREEGAVKGEIHFVGNTMIDTLMRMTVRRKNFDVFMKQHLLPELDSLPPKSFGLVTLHRPSNVDSQDNLVHCIDFLNAVSRHCLLVFPVHLRTQAAIEKFQLQSKFDRSVRREGPLGYLHFMKLMIRSKFVITDSGGIQEEAIFLGIKCFTLRKNTERPVTLEYGNQLIDLDKKSDEKVVCDYATVPHVSTPRISSLESVPPRWDGQAGERIMGVLKEFFAKR